MTYTPVGYIMRSKEAKYERKMLLLWRNLNSGNRGKLVKRVSRCKGDWFMKIGVIDVGGGFRGIYASGVLDYCLDQNIRFDLGIGISAGSANLSSFISGQRGRNYLFYTKYGPRKQYSSL